MTVFFLSGVYTQSIQFETDSSNLYIHFQCQAYKTLFVSTDFIQHSTSNFWKFFETKIQRFYSYLMGRRWGCLYNSCICPQGHDVKVQVHWTPISDWIFIDYIQVTMSLTSCAHCNHDMILLSFHFLQKTFVESSKDIKNTKRQYRITTCRYKSNLIVIDAFCSS